MLAPAPAVRGNRVHLYHSKAKYFEPRGPVSWDVAMTGTRRDWLVQVQRGDMLALNTTYETKLASWYESMGISVVYLAPGDGGAIRTGRRSTGPARSRTATCPRTTSTAAAEGRCPTRATWPRAPSRAATSSSTPSPTAGDFRRPGRAARRSSQGRSLTFELSDGDASQEIWHSITSCAPPCNRATRASPIRSPTASTSSTRASSATSRPAVYRRTWETPKNLPVGTYTYFCRIHPSNAGRSSRRQVSRPPGLLAVLVEETARV